MSTTTTTEEPAMNSFTADPAVAQTVARQMIHERVHDAEQRRGAPAIRADRRGARRLPFGLPTDQHIPWGVFPGLGPAVGTTREAGRGEGGGGAPAGGGSPP